MVELALADAAARTVDLGFVFFGREELRSPRVGADAAAGARAGAAEADLAIVMEPTDNALQAGCLGNVNATLDVHAAPSGTRRAPGWPTTRSIAPPAGSRALADVPVEEHEFDGPAPSPRPSSVTRVAGGIADNVIPDRGGRPRQLPLRPGPRRRPTPRRGCASCASRTATLEIVSQRARRGRVPSGNPLVERLRAAGDLALEPKQAWTPVAEFGRGRRRRGQLRPRRPGVRPPPRRAGRRRGARSAAYEVLERFACA